MASKLEYLKKYMSGDDQGDEKKKKKKKKSKHKDAGGFKIIDQNDFPLEPVSSVKSTKKVKKEPSDDEAEALALMTTQEELPQVAGIVDDSRLKTRFTTGGWKNAFEVKKEPVSDSDPDEPPRRRRHDSDNSPKRTTANSDASPPRRKRHDSDASPPRRKRHDSDASPPRRKRHDSDESPLRRKRHDSDESPPRRKRHDSDESPPRRKRHDSDESPPRRQRHDSDHSPPRRKRDLAPSNDSPPRRKSRWSNYDDADQPVKVKREPIDDDDMSPPRKRRNNSDSDISPPRRIKEEQDSDMSPPRIKKENDDDDLSPPRLKKTLDGKKAGLQDAKSLKEELSLIKEKERKMFQKLSTDVSGKGAATKVRGRLRDKEEEERAKKEANEAFRKDLEARYAKWNKGVKQLEAHQARVENDMHEMDKPLARDKNDQDLDAHLKAVERSEDPMLKYIQKKQTKAKSGLPQYPKYKGPAPPPNRFGIAPGYRWDGVVRSTGFEKKLFESQNRRKALVQEAHMWSTEDM